MFHSVARRALYVIVQQQWRSFTSIQQHVTQNPSHVRRILTLLGGGAGLLTAAITWERSRQSLAKEVQQTEATDAAKETEEHGAEDGDGEEKKRKGPGFRDRKIIEYENRIRAYSTPDKIFRYFATMKVFTEDGMSDIFMTAEDFIRTITPDQKQPEGLGLDQFKKVEAKKLNLKMKSLHDGDHDSIFGMLGDNGLISFADYMFLITVLSTPERHFEIAFRLFDINGDGEVSYDEFQQVTDVIRAQTATGKRHRDRKTTGNTLDKPFNSSLDTVFFGPNLDKKLTFETFRKFHKQLNQEILKMEFERYKPVDGRISEVNLANFLLVYANQIPKPRRSRMRKRVKKKFADDDSEVKGITFKEFMDLQLFLNHIRDVDTALSFYHVAGAAIDPETLRHVGNMVAKVKLSDRVLDVVFTLFDENDDGKLSNKEFVGVVKNRVQRGLDKPKELGLSHILEAMWKCAKKTQVFPDTKS
ncbi:calcium uptake protein 1, mitochondrial-like isoform X2 [Patiria miniata]|uniref:EF-hand domain-containing protein n=1 Tax=Patiria miniata TaxID=46514 RepID=A0A914ACP2_PATMI|nr:calcium uptake protein 1, mitochondrial-like isoform X1 [Patiria miniata]XP_038061504.1 calcium uptake protein 1, mitochondrial-like isoform X2 [Patiria miniata]